MHLFLVVICASIPVSIGHCRGVSYCGWGSWYSWSDCSRSCGGGVRQRDRVICCNGRHDLGTCLGVCGRSFAELTEDQPCGGTCFNGANSTSYPSPCDCDDAYFGSCCENRISCSTPSVIDNGFTSEGSDYYYGDNVTYSCNQGYNLTDGDRVRTCQRQNTSGFWEGATPRCAYAISCSSNPCQNGATCIDELDLYICECAYGWSGTNCELDILPPVFDACPDNITAFVSTTNTAVDWVAPNFTDPHGESEVRITAQNYHEPEASLPWGEYIVQYVAQKTNNAMQTECAFSVSVYPRPCAPLTSPSGGALACNGWNSRFGEICIIFCESTNDVPLGIRIENVYVCGATGNWLTTLSEEAACSEERSELTVESQDEEQRQHYYDGPCDEPTAQSHIRQAYIDILTAHDMAYMCTSSRFSDQCTEDNVEVTCA